MESQVTELRTWTKHTNRQIPSIQFTQKEKHDNVFYG